MKTQPRSQQFHKITRTQVTLILLVSVAIVVQLGEAKFLRRSRYYDEIDSPYGGATGERAIVTVRGARNPYDGSAPSKIALEDNPHRGPYPRGVYDRLDNQGYGRGRMGPGRYPMSELGGYGGGYGSGYGGGYGGYGGYGSGGYGPMFGAPNRIAVTGAFPVGYGARF